MEANNSMIKNQIQETFDQLITIVKNVDQEVVNKKPSENAWSVGQIVEHITISLSGFEELFSNGNIPAEREIDKKVQAIRDVFLNFDTKYDAPETIVPQKNSHQKEEIIGDIGKVKNDLISLAEKSDLALIPQHFEIPGFGKFTRLEWLTFAVFHTQRHTLQISKTITIV